MTDNFKLISTLLDFSEPRTFYFLQIIKRRKDNPEMKTGVSLIDQFYLYTPEDLEKLREKIIERCTKSNARAYINLNRLDLEKVAMHTVKQIMEYVIQKDYKSVKNAYATVCGSHHSEKNKRWLIDVDEEFLEKRDEIRQIVEKLHEEMSTASNGKVKYKILAEIPTRTGVHIITEPFNMEKFRQITLDISRRENNDKILKVDIQRNSPTVLFIL